MIPGVRSSRAVTEREKIVAAFYQQPGASSQHQVSASQAIPVRAISLPRGTEGTVSQTSRPGAASDPRLKRWRVLDSVGTVDKILD